MPIISRKHGNCPFCYGELNASAPAGEDGLECPADCPSCRRRFLRSRQRTVDQEAHQSSKTGLWAVWIGSASLGWLVAARVLGQSGLFEKGSTSATAVPFVVGLGLGAMATLIVFDYRRGNARARLWSAQTPADGEDFVGSGEL